MRCPLDRLYGRDDDLAALVAEIERSRLVAVQGPPGVGKTRLVGELVRRRDGAIACELAECERPDDITPRVAAAVGCASGEVPGRLAARPCVLVLDNAEQVAAGVAERAAGWLAAAPALRIVVTSRTRLHADGEVTFDLAPLDEAAAVALFLDRARAARRDPPEPGSAIAELVRRLDGLPLAIELAAARSRLFEPAQLLAELDAGLDLL